MDTAHELRDWVGARGRYPSNRADDDAERRLGSWLQNQKAYASGAGGGRAAFVRHNRGAILEALLPGWSEPYAMQWSDRLQQVMDWLSTHERWPSHSADGTEGVLGRWIYTQRDAERGRGKTAAAFKRERRGEALDLAIPGWRGRPGDDSGLVTRAEAAEITGYTLSSLNTLMASEPDRWPRPVGKRGTALLYSREDFIGMDTQRGRKKRGAPVDDQLVTRAEAAEILGYSLSSLTSLMNRRPDRWPAPVGRQKRGRTWMNLYRLDALRAATHSEGKLSRKAATITDEDGVLRCMECGKRFRALGRHLQSAHDMTGDEYREAHGLPRTAALEDDGVRLAKSATQIAAGTEAWEGVRQYQNPQYLAELQRRGVEGIRDSVAHREVVAQHRQPAQAKGVPAMWRARQEVMEQKARDAGFDSMADAIDQTRDMTIAAAAERIGIGKNTVIRRRKA